MAVVSALGGFADVRGLRTDDCTRPTGPGAPSHLFAAAASLLAYAEGTSPRTVLETYFRRAVSDEKWREIYLPLFQ